ncbi:MAG: hypothetical protein APF82_00580, partial [Sphingomonadales bacterium BRH_c42]
MSIALFFRLSFAGQSGYARREMSDLVTARPEAKSWIMGIHAYVPGPAHAADGRELIKLSANENPLGSSPAALAA